MIHTMKLDFKLSDKEEKELDQLLSKEDEEGIDAFLDNIICLNVGRIISATLDN